MKKTVTFECTKEVEFDTVEVDVAVRYDEEDMPNDAPFRKGDTWHVLIDADTGIIRDWPQGQTLDLHMKVCDCGNYTLKHGSKVIGVRDDNYVPDGFPGEHYGDYIIFDIDATGKVAGWDKFGKRMSPSDWEWKSNA